MNSYRYDIGAAMGLYKALSSRVAIRMLEGERGSAEDTGKYMGTSKYGSRHDPNISRDTLRIFLSSLHAPIAFRVEIFGYQILNPKS